jgi:exportin-T
MTSLFERSSIFGNAANLLATHDHHLLLQEFENLKQSEQGWKQCVEHLVNNQITSDQGKFLSLQIIEHYLKTKYKLASEPDQLIIRQFMSSWLHTHVKSEKSFISRKAAQVFALIAVVDFPHRWKNFFLDLIQTCTWSLENIDFYLKILLALNTEIIDREIPHTTNETNLARDFKDYIRESCMNELAESWFKLLVY